MGIKPRWEELTKEEQEETIRRLISQDDSLLGDCPSTYGWGQYWFVWKEKRSLYRDGTIKLSKWALKELERVNNERKKHGTKSDG